MKRKDGYLLCEVGGQKIAVAVGERTREFHGMITFSDTGAFLWEHLEAETTPEALTLALTEVYDVTAECARRDVDAFLAKLDQAGLLDR